jgi:ankyrin repeat protein
MLGQWSCDSKALHKLLDYRPDLTTRDKEGNGPLHLLLKQSRPEASTLKALLDAGADPDERNKKGQTPLLTMRFQSPQTFENLDILLAAGANINARDNKGATVLSTASPDEINSLVAKGADINVRDYRLVTPMYELHVRHLLTSYNNIIGAKRCSIVRSAATRNSAIMRPQRSLASISSFV